MLVRASDGNDLVILDQGVELGAHGLYSVESLGSSLCGERPGKMLDYLA